IERSATADSTSALGKSDVTTGDVVTESTERIEDALTKPFEYYNDSSEIMGNWTGYFTCANVGYNATLKIIRMWYTINKWCYIIGNLSFSNSSHGIDGVHEVMGTFNMETMKFSMLGLKWMKQPEGWVSMFQLRCTYREDSQTIEVQFSRPAVCTTLSVTMTRPLM
ncbi:unnamed protein product, partial [Owenia fusiformis]